MVKKVALLTHSVVVKGAFAPATFSPSWLLGQDLIGKRQYDVSKTNVVSSEVTSLELDWLRVTVTPDTFSSATEVTEEAERVRDFALAILELLPLTPVGAMGLNHEVHFVCDDMDSWHRIGDRLTPKDFWEKFTTLAGMRSLSILGVRPDLEKGRIQITAESSNRFPLSVYVGYNDHYELEQVQSQPATRGESWDLMSEIEVGPAKTEVAKKILRTHWSDSIERATKVFDEIEALGSA